MKLRIQGNSLRLRLTRSEVSRFRETGNIQECLDFGDSRQLTYGLVTTGNETSISANYSSDKIEVRVPRALSRDWTDTDRVSMSAEQALGDSMLEILVEKDFRCIHKDAVGNEDAYPNPLAPASA